MARSPSHKFGQIIGEILEEMMHAPLAEIAEKHDLYLDYRHKRPARAGRKKVIWKDRLGNAHDLDYVLEQGGAEDVQGRPKAFIESAWRRYTKHSRNKAQEIQGAIVPLAETYADCKPFLAVTLAGVFTENSLKQLESHEFSILYIPYKSILKAFSAVGINAAFDERTPDAELQSKVDAYEALNPKRKCKIVTTLKRAHQAEFNDFMESLEASLNRKVVQVFIATLHGPTSKVKSIDAAVRLIKNYDESQPTSGFVRYEIHVRYSNGDRITGEFREKHSAIAFLKSVQ